MYREPCAKFTIRVTPKISDRPTATRNRVDALASPLRNWMTAEATAQSRTGARVSAPGEILALALVYSPERTCLISASDGRNFAPSAYVHEVMTPLPSFRPIRPT